MLRQTSSKLQTLRNSNDMQHSYRHLVRKTIKPDIAVQLNLTGPQGIERSKCRTLANYSPVTKGVRTLNKTRSPFSPTDRKAYKKVA